MKASKPTHTTIDFTVDEFVGIHMALRKIIQYTESSKQKFKGDEDLVRMLNDNLVEYNHLLTKFDPSHESI